MVDLLDIDMQTGLWILSDGNGSSAANRPTEIDQKSGLVFLIHFSVTVGLPTSVWTEDT